MRIKGLNKMNYKDSLMGLIGNLILLVGMILAIYLL